MRAVLLILLRPVSTLCLLSFLFAVYWTFNAYDDWNYPLPKFACFAALFIFIAAFQFVRARPKSESKALLPEIGVLALLLSGILGFHLVGHGKWAFERPVSDMGFTTIHAARLVARGKNPYSRTDVNPRNDTDAGYHGFHYGPAVILGYLPSAWFPVLGYRIPNLIYLIGSMVLLVLLIRKEDESLPERISNILFVFTAYLMAERFWFEVFDRGANDLFHIMLILAALLAFKRERIFWTGLLLGLSCAGKFAPGLFLLPFMPLRDKTFWTGLGAGLTPLLPFLMWDPAGIWRNAFWLRVVIPADPTSLYWITPKSFHWIFGAINAVAYVTAVVWSGGRKREFGSVLVGFTLLLIVADITQKQVHGNHLIWFYPLIAMLFLEYRDRLYALVSARLRTAQ